MSRPEAVADLDPSREVYVGGSTIGSATRAHLYNDTECWHTGDLRPVAAGVLFHDQPVCQLCAAALDAEIAEVSGDGT